MNPMANAHALVVGIDDGYQQVRKLPPVKDAAAIAALLANAQEGGYPPDQVRVLANAEATNAALRQALADLAARTDADSIVFVYFSGHGGRIESGPDAGEYLLPADADPTSDATLAATSLSGAAFTAALDALPARKVIVVFDCCHAGGIGVLKAIDAPTVAIGLPEAYYERLATGRGRVIFASSRDSEYSLLFIKEENGLFTKHLLAGLRGGVPSEDGLVRVFDLFEYLQPRVVAGAMPDPQHPVFKAHVEENFPVALRLGGQKGAVAKDADGYQYDAYVSYVDRGPDAAWVWDTLVPKLEAAGLRVAVSGDVEQPGVARVVNVERGMRAAKRTVVVLSGAYLADRMAEFENTLVQTMGIQEGTYRLLPVTIDAVDPARLPTRLSMLTTLDLAHPRRAEREFDRLVAALKGPLPTM